MITDQAFHIAIGTFYDKAQMMCCSKTRKSLSMNSKKNLKICFGGSTSSWKF